MNKTILFMIAAAIIIAVYDVWVIYKKGKFESISAHIIRISKQMPLVTLLLGILLGHLFWSMDSFDHLTRPQLIEKCKPFQE